MQEKTLTISFLVYQNLEDLPAKDRDLAKRAQDYQNYSYAPYSNFRVGAAIRLEDGRVVGNGNQENAAYSMCLCAERTALAAAHSVAPDQAVKAIAVTASPSRQLVSPCGACRQVLHEREVVQNQPIRVILQGPEGQWLVFESAQLLIPFPFGPENLKA
ncbi:MAG: cytidine deaminase [Haliscomenobacter sp.]|nr:cytidine deaminase [Haliscomenobacter sp.]MBK8877558.1 cytidine deaminase [Haliscomenobacter sp.]